MTEHGIELPELTSGQLYAVGSALEDLEQFTPAADALRRVALTCPDAPEAETALLKAISLYVHRLNRRGEARTLLGVHAARYPGSSWLTLADDLRRAASA